MKKQILFIDDEINILKALQRSLRSEREHWEMTFVQSGEQAMETLNKHAFDVVVSDMRMPGMDGAQLLARVKAHNPMMIRIILSGYSDQEMVMKSVKAAHQYLSKPCETSELIAAIQRACSLRDLLNTDVLKNMVGSVETIASLPGVYLKMMEALNSPETDANEIGRIISEDMGMTAKVLQIVNSSFFGFSSHISDTKEAVAFLGVDLLKALVLSVDVFTKMPSRSPQVTFAQQLQKHSIETGKIARQIAVEESFSPKFIEDLAMASLLHDLGKLLLSQYFSKQYQKAEQLAEQKSLEMFEAERKIFNTTHAEVGAYLLGLWGLPDDIIESIAYHQEPSRLGSETFGVCGALHIADCIERFSDNRKSAESSIKGLDRAYIKQHQLQEKLFEWQRRFSNA